MDKYNVVLYTGETYDRKVIEVRSCGECFAQAAEQVKAIIQQVTKDEYDVLTVTTESAAISSWTGVTNEFIEKFFGVETDPDKTIVADCVTLMQALQIAYQMGFVRGSKDVEDEILDIAKQAVREDTARILKSSLSRLPGVEDIVLIPHEDEQGHFGYEIQLKMDRTAMDNRSDTCELGRAENILAEADELIKEYSETNKLEDKNE